MSMGYVYILTNPSFREDCVKIGKTRRPVNVRSAELDNTAVPLPFVRYGSWGLTPLVVRQDKLGRAY